MVALLGNSNRILVNVLGIQMPHQGTVIGRVLGESLVGVGRQKVTFTHRTLQSQPGANGLLMGFNSDDWEPKASAIAMPVVASPGATGSLKNRLGRID
jgi:hypothetical protein